MHCAIYMWSHFSHHPSGSVQKHWKEISCFCVSSQALKKIKSIISGNTALFHFPLQLPYRLVKLNCGPEAPTVLEVPLWTFWRFFLPKLAPLPTHSFLFFFLNVEWLNSWRWNFFSLPVSLSPNHQAFYRHPSPGQRRESWARDCRILLGRLVEGGPLWAFSYPQFYLSCIWGNEIWCWRSSELSLWHCFARCLITVFSSYHFLVVIQLLAQEGETF